MVMYGRLLFHLIFYEKRFRINFQDWRYLLSIYLAYTDKEESCISNSTSAGVRTAPAEKQSGFSYPVAQTTCNSSHRTLTDARSIIRISANAIACPDTQLHCLYLYADMQLWRV